MKTNDDDSQSSLQEIIYDASRERVFHCQHFHSKQVLNQNVGSEKVWTPPERPLCGLRGKKQNAKETQGKGKERPTGLRSFRQRPVRYLLKSFHSNVGSVS